MTSSELEILRFYFPDPNEEELEQALCILHTVLKFPDGRHLELRGGLALCTELFAKNIDFTFNRISHMTRSEVAEIDVMGKTDYFVSVLPSHIKYLFQYDINKQFLAAMKQVTLGSENPMLEVTGNGSMLLPIYKESLEFRSFITSPGYCHISQNINFSGQPDWIVQGYEALHPGQWLAFPHVNYLLDRGISIPSDRHFLWKKFNGTTGRYLSPLATALIEARAHIKDFPHSASRFIADETIKKMYSTFVQSIRKKENLEQNRVYHPEWTDMIIATGDVNLFRKLDQCSDQPLFRFKDAVCWGSNDSEFTPNIDTADTAGKWHYQKKCAVTEEVVRNWEPASYMASRLNKIMKTAEEFSCA